MVLGPLLGHPVSPSAQAQEPSECSYDRETGEWRCSFEDDDGGGGNQSDQEPWWARPSIEIGLGVFGLTASAVGGGYTVLKSRRRRRNMRKLLDETDQVYSEHKTRPDEGLPALSELRTRVRSEHDAGRLSDEQFLELDKRVGERLAKLRLLKLDRDLPDLPDPLDREIRHVVEDGTVTWTDTEHVADRCEVVGLDADVAEAVVAQLAEWAEVDERAGG